MEAISKGKYMKLKLFKNLFGTTTLFVALFFLLLFTNCGKNNVRWVYYDETKCADKWTYKNNNEELKQNVVSYMGTKGVKIYEIEIFNDRTAESCSDCFCKTGRRFICKVPKSDVNDAKKEGFYQ